MRPKNQLFHPFPSGRGEGGLPRRALGKKKKEKPALLIHHVFFSYFFFEKTRNFIHIATYSPPNQFALFFYYRTFYKKTILNERTRWGGRERERERELRELERERERELREELFFSSFERREKVKEREKKKKKKHNSKRFPLVFFSFLRFVSLLFCLRGLREREKQLSSPASHSRKHRLFSRSSSSRARKSKQGAKPFTR